MAVVHISEEDAISDFGAVLKRVDEGANVVIDRNTGGISLVESPRRRFRTFAEALASIPKESDGVTDEDFARDVRSFREGHRDSLDSSPWD